MANALPHRARLHPDTDPAVLDHRFQIGPALSVFLALVLMPESAQALRCKKPEPEMEIKQAIEDEQISVWIGKLFAKGQSTYDFKGYAIESDQNRDINTEILWTKSCAGDYCGHDPQTEKTMIIFLPTGQLDTMPVHFDVGPCARNYFYLEPVNE